jgi:Tfp pilus assembly PilM family ATPase
MSRMLAIEISPRVIRAVEYTPGDRPVKIHRAAATERPGGEPAAVGQFLRNFLEQNGFTAKSAVVAYLGPVIEHRIFAIPPVTGKTREELLRGKIAQETSTSVAELRVTGEVVGKVLEQGFERDEVIALYVPEFEIRRLVFLLVEAGLAPVSVVSIPLALAGMHPADAADELCGFLHVEPSRCVISVSGAGKLRFSREFALEVPARAAEVAAEPEYKNIDFGGGANSAQLPPLSGEEVHAERLVTELTRSLLYFGQISRGGSITRLYWSGDPPGEAAIRLISERLKFRIAAHPAAGISAFDGEGAFDAATFGVPVGMAAEEWGPERVNLLPSEYIHRKERRGSYIAVAVILAVFLLANAGLYMGLHKAEKGYRDALGGAAAVTRSMAASPEEISRWMAMRSSLDEMRRGENGLKTPFTRWKPLLAALGAPVPPEMRFLSATFSIAFPSDVMADAGRGEVRGIVSGKTPAETQSRVNSFLSAVRAQPVLGEPKYTVFEIRPRGADGIGGYEQEFLLDFALRER